MIAVLVIAATDSVHLLNLVR